MHPTPSDGHREAGLEMSISIRCHVLNRTGQVWIDTDKPRVDTLSTRTKAIPRDKWQAALMPHLTAARTHTYACTHAGRQGGGKNSARQIGHPRAPSSIWTGRPHVLQKEIKGTWEAAFEKVKMLRTAPHANGEKCRMQSEKGKLIFLTVHPFLGLVCSLCSMLNKTNKMPSLCV